jgi:Flagellar biosynthesis protein, FliO
MKDIDGSDSGELEQSGVDGDWSYLRANLDNPRHHLAKRLGSGLAAWILNNWQPSLARPVRLALIARIPLGPRQTVALVEAEGRHLLVATSADGAASFFPLDPSLPSGPVESCVEPVRSGALPDSSTALVRDRMLSPGPGLGGRTGRRAGFSGRVSW